MKKLEKLEQENLKLRSILAGLEKHILELKKANTQLLDDAIELRRNLGFGNKEK